MKRRVDSLENAIYAVIEYFVGRYGSSQLFTTKNVASYIRGIMGEEVCGRKYLGVLIKSSLEELGYSARVIQRGGVPTKCWVGMETGFLVTVEARSSGSPAPGWFGA